MKRIRSINQRRLALVIVLLLLVSAGVLLWMRDIVREVFVLPLSYLIFLVGIFIRTTPQVYFWIVLLLISFVIAYRSLQRKSDKPEVPLSYEMAELAYDPSRRGRVHSWITKYSAMVTSGNTYYSSNFHQSLGRLLLELLAHRYHLPPLQVEQRLRSETLDVPSDVREYVLGSIRPVEATPRSLLVELRNSIVRAFRNFLAGRFSNESRSGWSSTANRVDPKVARIIKYIEEELEVSHDDSGR